MSLKKLTNLKEDSLKKLLELLQYDSKDTLYLRSKKITDKIINFASSKGYIFGNY